MKGQFSSPAMELIWHVSDGEMLKPDSHVVVILNRESGTMLGLGADRVKEGLEAAFHQHGLPCEIKLLRGAELKQALEEARSSSADAVIIGGGDGTVATAATVMAGSDKPLGVLPLGTFNLAARDLGVPLELEQAAEALLDAPIGETDVMEVNGKLFLCVVVLGFYPALAMRGEEYHGHWMVKAWKTACQVIRSVATFPPLDLVLKRADEAGAEVRTRTRFVALANNGYEDLPGLIPKRQSLDGGQMTVYVSHHRTRFGYLKSLIAWVLGRWKSDREMLVFQAKSLKISGRSHRKRDLAVMCDGEIERVMLPFEVNVIPRALKVFAPRLKESNDISNLQPDP